MGRYERRGKSVLPTVPDRRKEEQGHLISRPNSTKDEVYRWILG